MVAVTAGSLVAPRELLRPFLIIGATCAVLPDIDAIGRPLYGVAGDLQTLGGHRGFTHSMTFAALLGVVVSSVTVVDPRWRGQRLRLGLFVAAVTALHGVLDLFRRIGASPHPSSSLALFISGIRDVSASDQRAVQRTLSLLSAAGRSHARDMARAWYPVAAQATRGHRHSRAG